MFTKPVISADRPSKIHKIFCHTKYSLVYKWYAGNLRASFVDRKAIMAVDISVGESVRIIRELQELSQAHLAKVTGIPQSTISGIENDRIKIGIERAKVLARSLKCHPAVLVFPGWDMAEQIAA